MSRTLLMALLLTTVLLQEAGAMRGDERYHAVTLLDLAKPLPVEWLRQAGIDYVYTSAGIPIETGADGKPAFAASQREAFERVFELYRGTGVKVLLMSQLYTRGPEATRSVDYFGRTHDVACFRQPAFQQWLRQTIRDMATVLSGYEAFGGFMFDDGVHVRVDCCYCDLCREQFRAQYGIEPPPFEPHSGTGRVEDDDPVLLWERFQRESFEIYLRTQSAAARSVSDALLMVTIPSDAYYFGRFLNLEVAPEQSPLGAGALLQRIERLHPRHWQIFYTFPMARLPEATETGLQRWAIGNHITAHSARIMSQPEGPYAPGYGRVQYMSPAEIQRMARISIAEGANAICFWSAANSLPSYPQAFQALAPVYQDVEKIEGLLTQRRELPATVGLLYSTTTETFEQPWTHNTNERWQHLHAFEGLAYSLRRSNLHFQVIMEDEVTPQRLKSLRALVLPAVRFLTQSAASGLEQAAAEGLALLTAGPCLPLRGAVATDCNPHVFRRAAVQGYHQEQYLNEQWLEVQRRLLPVLEPHVQAPVRVYGDQVVGQIQRLQDGSLLVFVVNWNLHAAAEAALEGGGRVTDALSGRELGELRSALTLTVPPAGWRVLRVVRGH